MKLLIAALFSLFCAQARAGLVPTIVQTAWNSFQPAGKAVEIKNVDLVDYQICHMQTCYDSFGIEIYVWVDRDLGPESSMLHVIDVHRPFYPSSVPVERMGRDGNGYWVYKTALSVENGFVSDLYARLDVGSSSFYSNQGEPTSYFHVAWPSGR